MAAGNETRVDTALLVSTAETLTPLIKNLQKNFEQFQQEIKNSRGEWQGDTSDDIRNTAAQLKISSEEMLMVLNNYVDGLKQLAGIFNKAESRVSDTGKSLKFDKTFQ